MLRRIVKAARQVAERADLADQAEALLSGRWNVSGSQTDPARVAVNDAAVAGDGRPMAPAPPIQPTEPLGRSPRAWVPPLGWNLGTVPRGNVPGLTPFATLRAVASWDLVRCAINDLIGQIVGLDWVARGKSDLRGDPDPADLARAKAFLAMPDAANRVPLRAWLVRAVEEVVVTDALSLVPRRALDGTPLGLTQIDGATICPRVDVYGEYPLPPATAYQQIVYGRPETDFTLPGGDAPLWYVPMSPRVDSPYGRSRVEAILLTANLAARSNNFDLSWFTEGNIPEAIYGMPADVGEEALQKMQDYFDEKFAGVDHARSGRVALLPDGKLMQFQQRQWSYDNAEWWGRLICWAIGVSNLPLAKMMNRATSEQAEKGSTDSGTKPVAKFVAEILTRYLADELGIADVEIAVDDAEAIAPETAQARDEGDARSGLRTLNEIRSERGLPPYPDAIGARPFVITGSGPVYFDQPQPAAAPATPQPAAPPQDDDAEAKAELMRWRKVARKCVKAARPVRDFASDVLPESRRAPLAALLKCARDDRQVEHLFKAAMVGHGHGSRAWSRSEATIRSAVEDWLESVAPAVRNWAAMRASARKASGDVPRPPVDVPERDAEMIREALVEMQTGGRADAAIALKATLDADPARARAYAAKRAAELVGRRIVGGDAESGYETAANPNPRWAITETLRDDLRSLVERSLEEGASPQEIASRVDELLADPERAETIARTETGFAYNAGAADGYRELGVERVEVLDGDGCLPDGHDDGAPEPDDGDGVQPDAQANGQTWDVSDFARYPLGHPRCVRAAVPVTEA
ncbi:MAG: phage portal protein [Candidatus Polarisedimenticolia bacterium]